MGHILQVWSSQIFFYYRYLFYITNIFLKNQINTPHCTDCCVLPKTFHILVYNTSFPYLVLAYMPLLSLQTIKLCRTRFGRRKRAPGCRVLVAQRGSLSFALFNRKLASLCPDEFLIKFALVAARLCFGRDRKV